MKKLSLKLDDLKIESFETLEAVKAARGTVAGNANTLGNTCECITDDEPSCAYTCGILPGTTGPAFGPKTYDCPACV